jgi:hypothetical protein
MTWWSNTGLWFLAGMLGVIGLMLMLSYGFWRKKLSTQPGAKCGFEMPRLTLRGTHGETLRSKIKVDGPMGLMFATYIEEPWLIVTPASGIMPQELEVVAYTKHAPPAKRHSVTVRLLPVDGEAQANQLDVEVRLKKPRPYTVTSKL